MANLQKGEVSLPAGDKTYTLSYSVNAFCHLEEADGRSFAEIITDLMKPDTLSVRKLRQFVHAGLIDHHPDVTVEEAGRIIMAAGGIDVVMKAVGSGLEASMPDKEASGTPRPRNRADRRKVGTGPGS
jgi:hypothetical protein